MSTFTAFLKLLAPVPVLVGILHVVLGPGADVLLGAELSWEAIHDPVLDSQNRFYGVVFMGYGLLFWVCAMDLRKYAAVFRIAAGFVFLGGLARLISISVVGVPSATVVFLTVVELLAVPPLVWWHWRVLRDS